MILNLPETGLGEEIGEDQMRRMAGRIAETQAGLWWAVPTASSSFKAEGVRTTAPVNIQLRTGAWSISVLTGKATG